MRIDADRRTALAHGGGALHEALEAEQGRTSRALCDVIVNTLGRDHTLRHTYLRKRWQGLGLDFGDTAERSAAEAPELIAVRRKLKEYQSVYAGGGLTRALALSRSLKCRGNV